MIEISSLLIPFLGTTLGSALVFFMKNQINSKLEKILLGFAAGVMIAASVWSLIIPSIDMSEKMGVFSWAPAAIGFILGIAFLIFLEFLVPLLNLKSNSSDKNQNKLSKTAMLVLAVSLHNLPEGMAVGVTFAGALMGTSGVTFAGAFTLALGIAIQNIPEGAIISMPLCSEGMSKGKAFIYGVLSGAVEPVGAIFTILLAEQMTAILPYLLSFAAGAMFYVVIGDLVPETQSGEHCELGIIGATVGFVLMMALDVALG